MNVHDIVLSWPEQKTPQATKFTVSFDGKSF